MHLSNVFPSIRIAVLLGLSMVYTSAFAMDEAWQTRIGESEYVKSCASCHGQSGKGDGPVAEVLSTPPPDLTMISQRNNGDFPTTKIYHLISGGAEMGPHGSKQMPVWGDRYRVEAIGQMAGVPHDLTAEVIVHGRILSLVYYLESIQQ